MKISSKGRYALRVIIDLAEQGTDGYIPLKTISARQGISLKYMESIMALLSENKLVEGIHGKGGGYRLTREPSAYRVSDVLRATEGELVPVACLECGAKPCDRAGDCRTLPMWNGLSKTINDYFDGITVEDLMKK